MNDSRVLKDAESARSGLSHVPNQPALLPLYRDPGGMPYLSVGMPSRYDKPPDIWDTHGKIGKRFCESTGVFFSTLSARVQSLVSYVSEHTSPHVMSESQTPVQDQRCQSGPSARNSVIPSEGDFSRIMEQTNKDCRFRIFILTNSLHQHHLLVRRKIQKLRYVLVHNFLRRLCYGLKKWRWLNQ